MSGSPTPGPVLAFLTALGLHSLCALTSDPQAHPLLASQQPIPRPRLCPWVVPHWLPGSPGRQTPSEPGS